MVIYNKKTGKRIPIEKSDQYRDSEKVIIDETKDHLPLITKQVVLNKFIANGLNWSSMSSFEYDPEQWYQQYVLGIKASSKEMSFGSYVDKKIQDDPTFLPHLPRYELMQHKMMVMFDGIKLYGTPDGINLRKNKELADYKTGKKKWDKKRAQDHGQLIMYLLLIYITEKIKPEEFDCYIHWMETQDTGDFNVEMISDKIQTFKVKHTMQDLLNFGVRIKKVWQEMQEYVENKG
jgi:hypothetical protein